MFKRVVVFLVLVLALDQGIGWGLGQLYRRTFTGERGGLLNYALTKDADVLVLGSSRAQYQIMPAVLHQRLAMTAFNAGLKGHDFLYSLLFFDLWKRSHGAPHAILVQVDLESLLDRPSELDAAQIFSPYVGESALVREVLYSASPYKRFEYWSRAYRYNGKAFSIVRNLFVAPDRQSDGFIPAFGRLDPEDVTVVNALDQDATPGEYARRPFSATKVRYLRDLASYGATHQMRIFLFHTPLYRQDRSAHRIWTDRMHSLIAELPAVEFIDICEASHPDVFANQPTLYSDANHLNQRGAVILSTLLADELKARLPATVEASLTGQVTAKRDTRN